MPQSASLPQRDSSAQSSVVSAVTAVAPQPIRVERRPLRSLSARLVRALSVLSAVSFGVGSSLGAAHAYAPAIKFVPGSSPTGDPYPLTPNGTENLTFGYQFNTLVDRVVDGIAVFDQNNDGLSQFHKVGFWKTDWTGVFQLIGQYSFDPASASCVSDSMWCWIPIPLLTMNRDSIYMIAATWDQAAQPRDPLAYRTPPPGTGQSYVTSDTNLNYLFPVRSDPQSVENNFGVTCPNPTPVNVDLNFDPNDLTTLCSFPSRRADVDAGGYFSAVVSFYNPTSQVPAPLPVFGASAMFAWKRRMKKRIKQAAS